MTSKRQNLWTLPLILVVGILMSMSLSPARGDSVSITADFGAPADYPLVKTKFGVFNSGIVPLAHYRRDIALFDEVRPESLRIDLGWGTRWAGWAAPPVAGTAGHPRYDFAEMDGIAALLNAHNVRPYWSYCYVPDPLQNPPGDYRKVPADVSAWGRILGDTARHYHESRPANPVGYHEVYNEPDNGDFFHGTEQDYLAMYEAGSRAIRAADPDALVGGPALAFTDAWIGPFLDRVIQRRLPLDFFSFHYYPGVPYHATDVAGVIALVKAEFARRPALATTELHLNEYNAYKIDYPQGGTQDKYRLASALLHDFAFFLAQPAVTRVHWAQFMDSGRGNYSGMISIDGHRKAVFNAYALYARMPVDRRQVSVPGPVGVEGMASADEHRASLVLWSRADTARALRVNLTRLPLARGTFRVYRIDAEHASWGDDPAHEALVPSEMRALDGSRRLTWSGMLPPGGVVYLEADDGTGRSALAPNQVAKVRRVLHYYPDRDTTAYADFDSNTWIARMGMASGTRAEATVGVTAEGLPRDLVFAVRRDEAPRPPAGGLLAVRMDYEVGGAYTKGVLFHGPDLDGAGGAAPMPWGTRRPADQVVRVADLVRFHIAPGAYAPPHWSGRAQITFTLQNAGPGARARIILTAGR